jgi:3-phenylpropionate/trans-cinnamate dioxygenase ferredoxin reductase subunit
LATGARPRSLVLAADTGCTYYLRSYDDALAIRSQLKPDARIVIVGGGFVGLELAASARMLACSVTVLEAQTRVLMRGASPEIAEVVCALHRRNGVAILTGASIASITHEAGGALVTLLDGGTLFADLLIVGIGSVPDTDLARQAGLAIDNGIAVDGSTGS